MSKKGRTGEEIVGGQEWVAGQDSQGKLRRSSLEPGRGDALSDVIVSRDSLHAIGPDGRVGDNLYVGDQGSPGKRLPPAADSRASSTGSTREQRIGSQVPEMPDIAGKSPPRGIVDISFAGPTTSTPFSLPAAGPDNSRQFVKAQSSPSLFSDAPLPDIRSNPASGGGRRDVASAWRPSSAGSAANGSPRLLGGRTSARIAVHRTPASGLHKSYRAAELSRVDDRVKTRLFPDAVLPPRELQAIKALDKSEIGVQMDQLAEANKLTPFRDWFYGESGGLSESGAKFVALKNEWKERRTQSSGPVLTGAANAVNEFLDLEEGMRYFADKAERAEKDLLDSRMRQERLSAILEGGALESSSEDESQDGAETSPDPTKSARRVKRREVELERQLNDFQREAESLRSDSAKSRKGMETLAAAADEEGADRLREIADLKKRIAALQRAAVQSDRQFEANKAEISRLESVISVKESQAHSLSEALISKRKKEKAQGQEIAGLHAVNNELRRDLETAHRRIERLESNLRTQEEASAAKIRELETELEGVRADVLDLNRGHKQQLARLQEELKAKDQKIYDYEASLAQRSEADEAVAGADLGIEIELAGAKAEVESLKQKVAHFQALVEQGTRAKSDITPIKLEVNATLASELQSSLEKAQLAQKKAEEDLAVLQARVRDDYELPSAHARLEAARALDEKRTIEAEMARTIFDHAAALEVLDNKLKIIEQEKAAWHLQREGYNLLLSGLVEKIRAFEVAVGIKGVVEFNEADAPNTKLQNLEGRIQALQNKFLRLIQKNGKLTLELEAQKRELEGKKDDLERVRAEARALHDEDTMKFAQAQAQLIRLQDDTGQTALEKDRRISEANAEILSLRHQLETHAATIDAKNTAIAALEERVAGLARQIEGLQDSDRSQKAELSKLRAMVALDLEEIAALKQGKQKDAGDLEAQRALVGERDATISLREREIADLKRQNGVLKSEQDRLKAELVLAQQQILGKDARIEEQKQRILALDAEVANVALTEGALREDIAAKTRDIAALRQDVVSGANGQAAVLTQLRTQVFGLEQQLREVTLTKNQLEGELARLTVQHKTQLDEWGAARLVLLQRVEEVVVVLEVERSGHQSTRDRLAAALAAIDAQRLEVDGIRRQQATAGEREQDAVGELARIKDELFEIMGTRRGAASAHDASGLDPRDGAIRQMGELIEGLQRRLEADRSKKDDDTALEEVSVGAQPKEKKRSVLARFTSSVFRKAKPSVRPVSALGSDADRRSQAAAASGAALTGPDLSAEIARLQELLADATRGSKTSGAAKDIQTNELLEDLRAKLRTLEEEAQQKGDLARRLAAAETRIARANDDTSALEAELAARPKREDLASLRDENAGLRSRNAALESESAALVARLSALEGLLQDKIAELDGQKSDIEAARRVHDREVARTSTIRDDSDEEGAAVAQAEQRLRDLQEQYAAELGKRGAEEGRLRREVAALGEQLEAAKRQVADFAALQAELATERERSRELQQRIDGAAPAAGVAMDDPAERARREKAEKELLALRRQLLALVERGRELGNSGPVAKSIRTLSDGIGTLVHDDVVVGSTDKKKSKSRGRWFGIGNKGSKVAPEPEARVRFDPSINNAAVIRGLQEELVKLRALLSPTPTIAVDDASAHLDDDAILGFGAEKDKELLDNLARALAAVAGAGSLQEELDASRARVAELEAALGAEREQGSRSDGEVHATVSDRSIAVDGAAPVPIEPRVIYQDFGDRIGKLYSTINSLLNGSSSATQYAKREAVNAAGAISESETESPDFPDDMIYVPDNTGPEIGIRIYGPEGSKQMKIMWYERDTGTWKPGVNGNEEYVLLEQAEKIAAAKVDLMAQHLARLGELQDENARLRDELARLRGAREHMATPRFAEPMHGPGSDTFGGRRVPERVDHLPVLHFGTALSEESPGIPLPLAGGAVPRGGRPNPGAPDVPRPVRRPVAVAKPVELLTEEQANSIAAALQKTSNITFEGDKGLFDSRSVEDRAAGEKVRVAKVLISAWSKIEKGIEVGIYREGNAEDLLKGEVRVKGVNWADPYSFFTKDGALHYDNIKLVENNIPALKEAMQFIRSAISSMNTTGVHKMIVGKVRSEIEKYNKSILEAVELKTLITFGLYLDGRDAKLTKHCTPDLFGKLEYRDEKLGEEADDRRAVVEILGQAQDKVKQWDSERVTAHLQGVVDQFIVAAQEAGRPLSPNSGKRASQLERGSRLVDGVSAEAVLRGDVGSGGGRGGPGGRDSEA